MLPPWYVAPPPQPGFPSEKDVTTAQNRIRRTGEPPGSIFPEGFEAIGCEFGVAHRVLDGLVPEIMLHGPRVLAVVGQLVAARMPQHVRVNRERKRCGLACAGQHLAKAGRRHRRASLRGEHVPRWDGFALELAQGPQLPAPKRVDAGHAV